MKRFIKSAAAMLAVCLAFSSCGFDTDGLDSKKEEFSRKFDNLVMGDNSIDPTQTWNASVSTNITVTSGLTGTIKVYTANPFAEVTAPLITQDIQAGQTLTLTVARPQDVSELHVAYLDSEGYMRTYAVDATGQVPAITFADVARSRTRAAAPIESEFKFPSTVGDEYFLSDFPNGAKASEPSYAGWHSGSNGEVIYDYKYDAKSGVFYIDAANGATTEVNIYEGGNGTKVYIKGNFAPSKFYVGPNSEIYLLEGATLTLADGTAGAGNLQAGCNYYIADKASIVATDELKLNNSMYMYNRGTITATELEVNNASVFYNQGTVTLTGEISVENSESVIVNDGIITATGLHTAGSGHVQNNHEITINGDTNIDSNDNTWVNNGQYTTTNFTYRAGSSDVINNCQLTVTNNFDMRLGSGTHGFRLNAECGVVTKNLTMLGPSNIYMGSKSVFKVTNTASMGVALPGTSYGIHGPETGDYAVFQAKEVVKATKAVDGSPIVENQSHMIAYLEHVIVAADSHFENKVVSPEDVIILGGGAKMVNSQTGADVKIEASECNPGYNGTGKREDPVMKYFYAFEDLGATGDFDFNDVVLAVTAPVNGTSDVYLMASGGTLSTVVMLGSQQLGDEVHVEFGEDTGTMVNTRGITHSFVKLGEATNVTDPSALPLSIVVRGTSSSREVSAPATGETPLMIRVPGNADGKWYWPVELRNIAIAYPGFGAWGANYVSNADWYKNASSGVVTY